MESSENFHFCRVCLILEESEASDLHPIFAGSAKVAKLIYNLTGVVPVDVDKNVPCLICANCLRQVSAAEKLRKRILEANDHFVMMTAGKEYDMFKREHAALKRTLNMNENSQETKKKLKSFEVKILEKSTNFYVPKIYLDQKKEEINLKRKRTEEENLDAILEKLNTNPTSTKTPHIDQGLKENFETKFLIRKKELKLKKSPDSMIQIPKNSLSTLKIDKFESLNEEFEIEKAKIARESHRTPTKKLKKIKATRRYKCDECSEFYYDSRELDNHKLLHESKH